MAPIIELTVQWTGQAYLTVLLLHVSGQRVLPYDEAIQFFDCNGADKKGQRKAHLEQAAMDLLQSSNCFIRILAWLISCWCCCRQAAARVST